MKMWLVGTVKELPVGHGRPKIYAIIIKKTKAPVEVQYPVQTSDRKEFEQSFEEQKFSSQDCFWFFLSTVTPVQFSQQLPGEHG